MSSIIAIDVGGTFIDLVKVDRATGQISIEKQPATPDELPQEIVAGLLKLPGDPSEITRFLHGTTVTINALVQRRGARVGLITTRGFRDVLELGRGNRPSIYDWVWVPPEPLVPRSMRAEVRERMGPDGSEIESLDLDDLGRELEHLARADVEAIAVCFLHAYANPKHEHQARDAIARVLPRCHVTLSSEVAAEWHEYERTSTAVIDAYLAPPFAAYLTSLHDELRGASMSAPIEVMQSNGGTMALGRATGLPVRTLASGPAGGVIGAGVLARRLGHADVICADVGGTTYDVAVIEQGRVHERSQTDVEGLPVLAPTVDVVSIGAGGGSVAWFDDTDALRVGPVSAGARPGPACFGFGGDRPTVTDCQLVLGRLDAERFLGSRMQLDIDAAERAIHDRIAARLGMSTREAAVGITTIAENAMANALHSMTVERGLDPREFVLYSYGGGGGLFAAATATELEIGTAVVPRDPATFSAWGISASARREDASLTHLRSLDRASMGAMMAELGSLREEVVGRVAGLGAVEEDVVTQGSADLRFVGQEHTVTVEVDATWTGEHADLLADRFVERHRQLFGHGDRDASIQLVTVRCRATVPGDEPAWPPWTVTLPVAARDERQVVFGGDGPLVTSIHDRQALAVDQMVRGPSIIEEWSSSTLVPPGWLARMDPDGNLVLTAEASGG